ncbi:GNAT family N-acetyltransferase [Bacillus sonorensis]|uniref:N-acetyltransferase YjcF n=2 Tax=Bacillus sonorensis TaxID=119858 RepID=M5PHG2_9BACI|nr:MULTISPECIES: GNAT family N-acetyltransferase [Bacillus]TWK72912.1 putative N-acetyltransferase YjcF [Bacillus paralicheniformis]ASB90072.1 putative N-acetyltransferase YjcF [Bacillus sonorensis]EME76157.1 N-acetyltransferase YjcF [Bacillus sonorensis L12]MCZ0074624.1 GNAT family N-acetyltransferase [Bacillus sonorensis]MCZ0093732.1 GNAT family N-acetyltransferase [Bacillus sonorensis]
MKSVIVKNDQQLKDAFFVRTEVFIKEQHVSPEEEMDHLEQESSHLVIYDGKESVGAGRVRLVDGYGKLERICVLKSHRSSGIGNLIMEALETEAKKQGASRFMLNAQTQAVPFYEKHGYKVASEEFLDADIPHVKMIKE